MDLIEQVARFLEPQLWVKIDEYKDDDDWNGATSLNARHMSLKRARTVVEMVNKPCPKYWQPIRSAPRSMEMKLMPTFDIWVVDNKTGKGYRIPDASWCPHDGEDAWAGPDGKWVSGKRFYDEEGDECYDPACTDNESMVATHWMPRPEAPIK